MNTHCTLAFVLENSSKEFQKVNEIREQNDKAFARWMPHINFIFPFAPFEELPNISKILKVLINQISTFELCFDDIGYFPQRDSNTFHLKSSNETKLFNLFNRIEMALPDYKSKKDFHPHLTVGQWKKTEDPENVIKMLKIHFNLPIRMSFEKLSLLRRTDESPFEIFEEFELNKIGYTIDFKRVNVSTVKATLNKIEDFKRAGSGAIFPPIVVLDTSGSMGGKRITDCLNAIKRILEKVGKIHLITYDKYSHDRGEITILPRIEAGGQTYFKAAYDQILNVISSRKDNIQIVFLTDGEDGSSNTTGEIQWFKTKLQNYRCVIHTIGIESGSHTQNMIDLSKCGTVEGTYGYFSNSMQSYETEADRLINILGSTSEIVFKNSKYFLGSDPLEIYFEDCEQIYENGDQCDKVDFLAYQVNKLIEKGTKTTLHQIQECRNKAQEIFLDSGKLLRNERKNVRNSLQPIHKMIDEFYQLINSGSISHEKLAKLNVAARDARSSKFTKKIVDRLDKNLEIIENEDKKIQELTEEFRNNPLDSADFKDLTCMLSCMTVEELLKDGSCMGIGIQAIVREACIVDPTLLKIEGLSTSCFGCGEFLEAAEYSCNKNEISYGSVTNVVVDSSRKPVSGVLPLFINEDHWKMAKLYVRRMASHLCCKDPVVGTARTVFYTYLHTYVFCKNQAGEFYENMSEELLKTLVKIQECFRGTIPYPETFCKNIQCRMPDQIPSIPLYLEACEALKDRDPKFCLENFSKQFENYIFEETLRRQKLDFNIQNFCKMDKKYWITPFVDANTPTKDNNIFGNIRRFLMINYPNAIPFLDEKIGFIEYGKGSKNNVEVPDPENYVLEINEESIRDINLDLPNCFKALIKLQASELKGVSDYVQNYKDIFKLDVEEVEKILKSKMVDHINLIRKSRLSEVINNNNSAGTTEMINKLRNGVSLLERVAIMHGNCYVGRNIMEYGLTAETFEEVKMMILGKYDLAPLIDYFDPIIVPTVMDIDNYHGTSKDGDYNKAWIPNYSVRKLWIDLYGRNVLKQIRNDLNF